MEPSLGAGRDRVPPVTPSCLLGLWQIWGNDLKKKKKNHFKRQRKTVVSRQLMELVNERKSIFSAQVQLFQSRFMSWLAALPAS